MGKSFKLKPGMTQVEQIQSARKVWGFKPVTRVVVDKKNPYKRKEKYGNRWE